MRFGRPRRHRGRKPRQCVARFRPGPPPGGAFPMGEGTLIVCRSELFHFDPPQLRLAIPSKHCRAESLSGQTGVRPFMASLQDQLNRLEQRLRDCEERFGTDAHEFGYYAHGEQEFVNLPFAVSIGRRCEAADGNCLRIRMTADATSTKPDGRPHLLREECN
jgi:hypothetical protein